MLKRSIAVIFLLSVIFYGFSLMNEKEKNPVVLIKTSKGDIKVMLYNDTPKHRDNFLKLAKEDYYDNRIFHRVIRNFMIQAGWTKQGVDDPDYRLPAEIEKNHFHKRGALAAARQGDRVNPKRKSSGCQFYIVDGRKFTNEQLDYYEKQMSHKYTQEQREIYTTVGGAPHLDGSYTVFGEVLEGMDVVDAIAAVKTGSGNKPLEDVTIISMEVLEE
ncbi:MAG: peptidylprolyl isomerase [Bacteroidota bacterium]